MAQFERILISSWSLHSLTEVQCSANSLLRCRSPVEMAPSYPASPLKLSVLFRLGLPSDGNAFLKLQLTRSSPECCISVLSSLLAASTFVSAGVRVLSPSMATFEGGALLSTFGVEAVTASRAWSSLGQHASELVLAVPFLVASKAVPSS